MRLVDTNPRMTSLSVGMLRNGSKLWQLWLFGVVTTPIGIWLWHRQGTHFGLGPAMGRVSREIAYVTLAGCLGLVVLGFLVGER